MNDGYLEIISDENYFSESIIKFDEVTYNKLIKVINNSYDKNSLFGYIEEANKNDVGIYEITAPNFLEILVCIAKNNGMMTNHHIDISNSMPEINGFASKYNDIIDRYNEFVNLNMESSEYYVRDFCTNLFYNQENMKLFFDLSYELTEKDGKYYKFRDLALAKDDIVKNLKYFLSNEQIAEYREKFESALKKENENEAMVILNNVQALILIHWKEYIKNIENFKQGDNFKLICHSTSSSEFNGEFYTRYISTSLLTEKIMDTYSHGFGFVFAPENIIGAKSKDMYVFNGVDDEQDLMFYSTIKRIDSPERLIEECLDQQKENKKNNDDKSVYSEVVIDGFNPIAIFCLTDGSKTLNNNYNDANKLQEQFPNLRVIEIDKTYYKKDEELFEDKKKLIGNIKLKLAKMNPYFKDFDWRTQDLMTTVTDDMVSSYDLFWSKFLELKEKGNYSEEDIIDLFQYNTKLVTMYVADQDILSEYNYKEIETILMNNSNLRIKDILNGKVESWKLDRIYENLNGYIGNQKLDSIIPGLSTFLDLYGKLSIKDKNSIEYNNCFSFKDINQQLINYIQDNRIETANTINNISKEIDGYKRELFSLKTAVSKKEEEVLEYNNCKEIIDNEYYYSMASSNIKVNEGLKESYNLKIDNCNNRELSLNELLARNEQELIRLNKHKFINSRRIGNKQLEKQSYENILESNAIYKQRCIEEVQNIEKEINDIKNDFNKKTNISFSDYPNRLKIAKESINSIDIYSLDSDIALLTNKIIKLEIKIAELENEMNVIKEEEHKLSPDEIISLMEMGYDIDDRGNIINQNKQTNIKQKGYTMVGLLGLITSVATIGIIIYGYILFYK